MIQTRIRPHDTAALAIAASLCRRFEGLYLRPYLCPAGVPTIGYGATRYEDGRRVSLLDEPITRQRAEALLDHELRSILPFVVNTCPTADTAERLAALLDFTFNLGIGNLRASTLRRTVAARDWEASAVQIQRWVFAGGVRLDGLVTRRKAEAALLLVNDQRRAIAVGSGTQQ